MNFYQTCPTSATSADSRAVHPADFDPQKYLVLRAHWFGVKPCANAGQLADLIGREAA